MKVAALIVAFAAMAAYDAPALVRDRMWGDLAAFAGLIVFGFVISLLQVIGMPLPNPLKWIEAATAMIVGLFR